MPTTATPTPATARCPFHGAAGSGLQPASELVLPRPQRVVVQHLPGDDGRPQLHLFVADKEISFDEPELFAFGETLAKQTRFAAGDALTWAAGSSWPQVQALLQTLLDEGVLQHAADAAPEPARALGGDRSAPLPAGPAQHPHDWREGEPLMAALTGRPLELGWLELVVPIFRVAHSALDDDGRQVGESNVFPPALRMDIPTRWRTCIYAGTRHQTERPMNVTALKAMREHWPVMMAALSQVRAAYLRRYPDAAAGWTVGHLERLATAVLALPSYALMRADAPVDTLHPALSSLFRVTDGLRMVMHQMLFVPIGEPTLSPDAPMDAERILAYAERNYSFHSEHGVCAGPQAMVREFLAVLVDGQVPADVPLPDAVQAALADVEAALDYALLGLQAYAATFSLWPAMTRCYEQLAQAAASGTGAGWARLQQQLAPHEQALQRSTFLAHESWRVDREAVYADMVARCGQGLGQAVDATTLPRELQATPHAGLQARLDTLLQRRLGDDAPAARAALVQALAAFLQREQAVLRVAVAVQARINAHLGRPAPQRTFDSADIDLHNRLQGAFSRRLPYLPDELESLFGLALHISADGIEIETREPDVTATAPAHHPDSADMGSAELRATRHVTSQEQ